MENITKVLVIRKATIKDLPGLCVLENDVWGWTAAGPDELKRRLELDADSVILAIIDNKILGSITCVETQFNGITKGKWRQYLKIFGLKNQMNDCLYIVSISAMPDAPRGVGCSLLKAMIEECSKRGLKYLAYGSRIPGYCGYCNTLRVEEYVNAVKDGRIIDPVLSIANLLKFSIGATIKDYYEDKASLNYGVIVYKEI